MSLIPMDQFVSKEVRIEPSENGVTLYLGTVPIKDFANEELACAYVDDSLIEDKSSLIQRIIREQYKKPPKRRYTVARSSIKYRVRCIETGEEFDKVQDAVDKHGISKKTIYRDILQGRPHKNVNRVTFERID